MEGGREEGGREGVRERMTEEYSGLVRLVCLPSHAGVWRTVCLAGSLQASSFPRVATGREGALPGRWVGPRERNLLA